MLRKPKKEKEREKPMNRRKRKNEVIAIFRIFTILKVTIKLKIKIYLIKRNKIICIQKSLTEGKKENRNTTRLSMCFKKEKIRYVVKRNVRSRGFP